MDFFSSYKNRKETRISNRKSIVFLHSLYSLPRGLCMVLQSLKVEASRCHNKDGDVQYAFGVKWVALYYLGQVGLLVPATI